METIVVMNDKSNDGRRELMRGDSRVDTKMRLALLKVKKKTKLCKGVVFQSGTGAELWY